MSSSIDSHLSSSLPARRIQLNTERCSRSSSTVAVVRDRVKEVSRQPARLRTHRLSRAEMNSEEKRLDNADRRNRRNRSTTAESMDGMDSHWTRAGAGSNEKEDKPRSLRIQPLRCEPCSTFIQPHDMAVHLAGSRHRDNTSSSKLSSLKAERHAWRAERHTFEVDSTIAERWRVGIRCIPCDSLFDVLHNYGSHLKGRRHREAMEGFILRSKSPSISTPVAWGDSDSRNWNSSSRSMGNGTMARRGERERSSTLSSQSRWHSAGPRATPAVAGVISRGVAGHLGTSRDRWAPLS
jgi:hypothetical protein